MKRTALFLSLMLCSAGIMAKDIKTVVVTTTPQMHCNNCELKIKNNLRFEKGVKKIETDISIEVTNVSATAAAPGKCTRAASTASPTISAGW